MLNKLAADKKARAAEPPPEPKAAHMAVEGEMQPGQNRITRKEEK